MEPWRWPEVKPGPLFADFMAKNPLPAAEAAATVTVAEAAAAVVSEAAAAVAVAEAAAVVAEAAAAAAVAADSEDEDIWEKPVVFPFQPPVEEAAAVAEADWADAVDERTPSMMTIGSGRIL